MQNKNIFFILIIVIFFLIGFFLINNSCTWRPCLQKEIKLPNEIQYVKIAEKIIKVDLALTQQEQEQGLSGREKLEENEGMLFVFDYMGQYSFWMKDMNFALDIIWLAPSESEDRKDLQVVYIKKNAQPDSYPETFVPDKNAKYILEVSASFSEKNNLRVGDRVEFLPP